MRWKQLPSIDYAINNITEKKNKKGVREREKEEVIEKNALKTLQRLT